MGHFGLQRLGQVWVVVDADTVVELRPLFVDPANKHTCPGVSIYTQEHTYAYIYRCTHTTHSHTTQTHVFVRVCAPGQTWANAHVRAMHACVQSPQVVIVGLDALAQGGRDGKIVHLHGDAIHLHTHRCTTHRHA